MTGPRATLLLCASVAGCAAAHGERTSPPPFGSLRLRHQEIGGGDNFSDAGLSRCLRTAALRNEHTRAEQTSHGKLVMVWTQPVGAERRRLRNLCGRSDRLGPWQRISSRG